MESIHFTLNPLRTPDFLGMSEWVHGIKHKKKEKRKKNSANENLHENNDSLGRAEAEIAVVDVWRELMADRVTSSIS